jgi:hypothetical protein
VREIYALNDATPIAGLRNLNHHTGTGRPHDMPLTEDWLVDFARFFAIDGSEPQHARALGPHVARAFATGTGVGADGSADPLVLRDLTACTRGDLRSLHSLIFAVARVEPRIFDGCLAEKEANWIEAMRGWLSDAGIAAADADRLAADPPLPLYLMVAAAADTGGRTLGALGSILMGETLAAALPEAEADAGLDTDREAVFHGAVPATMAEVIRFLQGHYRFAEGAQLCPADPDEPPLARPPHAFHGGADMLDSHTDSKPSIPLVEVADFIEMGRLVAQWSVDPATRPGNVAELKDQLDGIAVVPQRVKNIEFVQGSLDTLVVRLPVKEMLEAEADTGGRTLGALGSILMGETIAAALPEAEADVGLDADHEAVFHGEVPATMADVIRFLQRHYRFAEGAQLCPADPDEPPLARPPHAFHGGADMLDSHSDSKTSIPLVEVADFIEMGRLVAQWSVDPATRPGNVAELKDQLDGIAVVPQRVKNIEFVQGSLDTLVVRLPVKEMLEESLERMTDPMGDTRYPLPQFYSDHYRPGFGPVMTPLDTLLARVGDYTIAQCR